ncbi:unannotated protein [freshwater metagenome]|uniref:Unannotated protein n=1 Tax=freshwater metagenome TaxID=449393 RepID=A0A6J6ML18_9ZZZZ
MCLWVVNDVLGVIAWPGNVVALVASLINQWVTNCVDCWNEFTVLTNDVEGTLAHAGHDAHAGYYVW